MSARRMRRQRRQTGVVLATTAQFNGWAKDAFNAFYCHPGSAAEAMRDVLRDVLERAGVVIVVEPNR